MTSFLTFDDRSRMQGTSRTVFDKLQDPRAWSYIDIPKRAIDRLVHQPGTPHAFSSCRHLKISEDWSARPRDNSVFVRVLVPIAYKLESLCLPSSITMDVGGLQQCSALKSLEVDFLGPFCPPNLKKLVLRSESNQVDMFPPLLEEFELDSQGYGLYHHTPEPAPIELIQKAVSLKHLRKFRISVRHTNLALAVSLLGKHRPPLIELGLFTVKPGLSLADRTLTKLKDGWDCGVGELVHLRRYTIHIPEEAGMVGWFPPNVTDLDVGVSTVQLADVSCPLSVRQLRARLDSRGLMGVGKWFGVFSNVEEIVFETLPAVPIHWRHGKEGNLVAFPFENFAGARVVSVPVGEVHLDHWKKGWLDEWARLATNGVICLEKMVFRGASLKYFVDLGIESRSDFSMGEHGSVVLVERRK
jgi:hypothetical protein